MKKILLYLILPAAIVSAVNAGNDAPVAQLEPVVGSQPVVFAPAVEAADEFDGPARVSMCDRLNNGVREQYNAFSNRAGEVKTNVMNRAAGVKQSAQNKFNQMRQGVAARYNQASGYAQAKYAEAKPAVQNRAAQARDAAQQAAQYAQDKYAKTAEKFGTSLDAAGEFYEDAHAKMGAATDKFHESIGNAVDKLAKTRAAGAVKRGVEPRAQALKNRAKQLKEDVAYWFEEDDYDATQEKPQSQEKAKAFKPENDQKDQVQAKQGRITKALVGAAVISVLCALTFKEQLSRAPRWLLTKLRVRQYCNMYASHCPGHPYGSYDACRAA